jgi:hypothetical protein
LSGAHSFIRSFFTLSLQKRPNFDHSDFCIPKMKCGFLAPTFVMMVLQIGHFVAAVGW